MTVIDRSAREQISADAAPLFGAIEGGGTKFVVLAGTGPGAIYRREMIATTMPNETLDSCIAFFQGVQRERRLTALGVGMFGPVDLDPTSSHYGYITSTPKAGWTFTDVVGRFAHALEIPIGWENDVNAALLGERRWGALADVESGLYLTIGTGVGGGAYVSGAPLHGLIHPEMGHVLVPALPGDEFPGNCPYHGRCLEGLISGPAIAKRTGLRADDIDPEHPVWEQIGEYLAMALMTYALVLSPHRIVLGGGVSHQPRLLPLTRAALRRQLNGYLQHPLIVRDIDDYVVLTTLGGDAGVLGALEVARAAAHVD